LFAAQPEAGWQAFLGNGRARKEHAGKAEDDGAHQAPYTPEQETPEAVSLKTATICSRNGACPRDGDAAPPPRWRCHFRGAQAGNLKSGLSVS